MSVNGKALEYDETAPGLSTTYQNGNKTYSFGWDEQGNLDIAIAGAVPVTFGYDTTGLRQFKISRGVRHDYYYDGDRLIAETIGDDKYILYYYDETDSIYSFRYYNGTSSSKYYLFKNLQGDVIEIRDNHNGKVATYKYDPWGNVISITDSSGTAITDTAHIAYINPIRYRSYYYDVETGFYYLQSRYYDPAIGRFISADNPDFIDAAISVQSTNLYAYCGNNPIARDDDDGQFWDTVFDVVSLVSSVVEVVANPSDPTNWVGLVADTVDLLPFVSGVGEVTKAVTKTKKAVEAVDTAHDAVRTADNAKDASETITKMGKSASNVSACFVAGTPLKTEYGLISIEQIKAGDLVWASDPETGDVSLKQVVQTFVNESDELIHVFVNGEEIITTPEHPFYSPIKGWTSAAHLRAGDILVLVNGSYVVVEKVQHELLESPITVYNFEVEDYHTYYVGDASVLVHNACGADITDFSTGRTQPSDLYEQLAMESAMADPFSGNNIIGKLNDPRLQNGNWSKYSQYFPTSKGNIEIHYIGNMQTGQFRDFKFVNPAIVLRGRK